MTQMTSRVLTILASLSLALNACSDVSSPANQVTLAISNGKSAPTADMTVTSASPDSASQDTTLDVVISGGGFVQGTVATWKFGGVEDPVQVRTNSTRYVNSRQLVANITISRSASLGKWDIVVTAAGQKGGIGTEAFTVKARGSVDTNSRVHYSVTNTVDVGGVMVPAGITGDGRLADGSSAGAGNSEYQGGFCGAHGRITNGDREPGDLSYDPDALQPAIFCGVPRYYVFNLDGVATNTAPLSRVFAIWTLAPGQSMNSGQAFGVQLSNCTLLAFDSRYGGDDLRVTRIDSGTGARQWLIQSQGAHIAACANHSKKGQGSVVATGKKYYLPFAITVTEVPYPYPTFP